MSHTRPEYSRIIANRALISVTAIVGMFILGMEFSEQAHSGSLEPAAPPAPTMHTLEQSPPTWDQNLPVAERFVRVLPTTATPAGEGVLDLETGLVFEQSPLTTTHTWSAARVQCAVRTVGDRKGWRLPSVHELASLVDPTNGGGDPDLPAGHPFSNVQSDLYWTATTDTVNPSDAWFVRFSNGGSGSIDLTSVVFVWCVRGGGPLSDY